mgnify:CR=1 FL=1
MAAITGAAGGAGAVLATTGTVLDGTTGWSVVGVVTGATDVDVVGGAARANRGVIGGALGVGAPTEPGDATALGDVIHDGRDAANAVPAPRTRIPARSREATDFGLFNRVKPLTKRLSGRAESEVVLEGNRDPADMTC